MRISSHIHWNTHEKCTGRPLTDHLWLGVPLHHAARALWCEQRVWHVKKTAGGLTAWRAPCFPLLRSLLPRSHCNSAHFVIQVARSIRAFPLLSHSKAILSLQRIIIVWSPQTAGTHHSKMCARGCMRVWIKSVKMCVEVSNAHQNVKCVQMKQEVWVNVCKRKHKVCVNKSVKCV